MTAQISRRVAQQRWTCALLTTAVLVTVLSCVVGTADDRAIFSGPQAGEPLPPFSMRTVLGPQAGQEQDLVVEAGGDPVLLVFVHERTRPAFGLANLLMRFAATREEAGLQRGLIFLSDDATVSEAWIKRIPTYFEKQTPVGISVDGAEGPGAYGLNRNVALTILVGKAGKTTANFALVQPSIQADGPKIVQAIVDATGGGDAPDITKFLPQGMRERARMQRQPESDVRLRELLRAVIQKDATEDDVRQAAKVVEEYLAKKPQAQKELGAIARRVVDSDRYSDYGTAPAREKLKVWAEKYGPPTTKPLGTSEK